MKNHPTSVTPTITHGQLRGGASEIRRLAFDYLRELGGEPREWSNGPRDRYEEHSHPYYKVLFCLEGSIDFLVQGETMRLAAGDRLDLPPNTPHSAVVGKDGVVCVEVAL